MAELGIPIVGPAGVRPEGGASEDPTGFEFQGGSHYQIPSSISEEGKGFLLGASLNVKTNSRDTCSLGGQLNFDENEGGDFYQSSEHFRGLMRIGCGEESIRSEGEASFATQSLGNRYLGFGKSNGATTLEIGSDLWAMNFLYRPGGGAVGIAISPYLSNFVAVPFESEEAETAPLISIRFGLMLTLQGQPIVTRPPPLGVSDLAVAFQIFADAHRLLRTKMTADALVSPSALLGDYTQELFGEEEGLPSPRLEGLGFFNSLSLFSSASEEAEALKLQLRADETQRPWLIGSKIVTTAAAFALSASDESPSLLTHGIGGGLELLHFSMAGGTRTKPGDLLLLRLLTSLLPFAIGWGLSTEKFGQALLLGGHQAHLATTFSPDPAGRNFAREKLIEPIFEFNLQGGRFFGGRAKTHLDGGYFTEGQILLQTLPGPSGVQEDVTDPLSGRDPRLEAAKAKTVAVVGWETQKGSTVFGLGARALLLYGDTPKPLPGVGLQAGIHYKPEKGFIDDVGIDVAADLVGGEAQTGMIVGLGWRI